MFANLTTSAMLFHVQFGKRIGAMHLDCPHAQAKPVGDFLVGDTFHQDCHCLAFARSQLPDPVSGPITRRQTHARLARDVQKSVFYGKIERFGREGFFKEIDRPQLHRTHRHGNIAVCRQDNNGPSHPFLLQDFQKLQAINIFHPDVEQDRSRSQVLKLFQKNRFADAKGQTLIFVGENMKCRDFRISLSSSIT